jgi:hypothetical protein
LESLKKSDRGNEGPRHIIGPGREGGRYSSNMVGRRGLEVPGSNKDLFWALINTVVSKNAGNILSKLSSLGNY